MAFDKHLICLCLAVCWSSLIANGQVPPRPRNQVTQYNENLAKTLVNMAAAAYADSPLPCIARTFPAQQQWQLVKYEQVQCDDFKNTCASFILRSDVLRQFIISYRGTNDDNQLFLEGWESTAPKVGYYGLGQVHPYFLHALESVWPTVEPALQNAALRGYSVIITGHSLGGALAAMAAIQTVRLGYRTGDQIKLITFGEPRIGNSRFAFNHDAMVPYSFRIVHSRDIVPHLPKCNKNSTGVNADAKSKPCDPTNESSPYHHGIEVWYPLNMTNGSPYRVCLGEPRNEDMQCSDLYPFGLTHYNLYFSNHRHYFNHEVPLFGHNGCIDPLIDPLDHEKPYMITD